MGSDRCHVCLLEGVKVNSSALLLPLLHKHLGVFVLGEVQVCEGCSQLLQLWDDFSGEARVNLRVTQPTAIHQYKVFAPGLGVGKEEEEVEAKPKPDPDLESPALQVDNVAKCSSSSSSLPQGECSDATLDLPEETLEMDIKSEEPQSVKEEPGGMEEASTEASSWEVSPMHEIDCSRLFDNKSPVATTDWPHVEEEEILATNSYIKLRYDGSVSPPYVPSNSFPSSSPRPEEEPLVEDAQDTKEGLEHLGTAACLQHLCTHCDRAFTYEILLINHIKLSHPTVTGGSKPKLLNTVKTVACPKCYHKSSTHQNLIKHILESHLETKGNKFYCVFCKTLLSSRSYLITHLNNHTVNFKCKFCTHIFSTQRLLHLHIAKRHRDSDYRPSKRRIDVEVSCPFCSKVLSSSKALSSHILSLHQQHNASPSSKRILKNHIFKQQRKSINKSNLRFHCKFCNNTFSSAKGLSCHMHHHNLSIANRNFLERQQFVAPSQAQGGTLTAAAIQQQANLSQPPKLKLKIVKRKGSFACEVSNSKNETMDVNSNVNVQSQQSSDSPHPELNSKSESDNKVPHPELNNESESDSKVPHPELNNESESDNKVTDSMVNVQTESGNDIMEPEQNVQTESSQSMVLPPVMNNKSEPDNKVLNPALNNQTAPSNKFAEGVLCVQSQLGLGAPNPIANTCTTLECSSLTQTCIKPYWCNFCGKKLLSKLAMEYHIQQSHIKLSLRFTAAANFVLNKAETVTVNKEPLAVEVIDLD